MQRVVKRLPELVRIPRYQKSSGSFAKQFDSFFNEQFTPENRETKNSFEASFRENNKSAFRSKVSKHDKKKGMDSQEMPPSYFENEQEKNLNSLEEPTNEFSDILSDYFESSSKAELLRKAERMLEAARTGDFEKIFETDRQELEDMYSRYDYFKVNYLEQVSNNKMKLQEETKKREEDFFEAKSFVNLKHLISDRLGIKADTDENWPQSKSNEQSYFDFVNNDEEIYETIREKMRKELGMPDEENFDSQKVAEKDEYQTVEETKAYEEMHQEFIDNAKKPGYSREATKKKVENDIESMRQLQETLEDMREEDPEDFHEVMHAQRVSLRSKLGIYKCYLEGWNIRDISKRYGILPARAKVIVWNMQNFFEEVMPNISFDTLQLLLVLEGFPHHDVTYVDYGVDLYTIAQEEEGQVFNDFGRPKLSAFMPHISEKNMDQDEIESMIYKRKMRDEDYVIESLNTKGVQPHRIKNWIIYKGPGSLKVSNQFRKIVEGHGRRDYLPYHSQSRLKDGPRIACLGYKVRIN